MAEIFEVDRKLWNPPVVTVPTYRFSPYFGTRQGVSPEVVDLSIKKFYME